MDPHATATNRLLLKTLSAWGAASTVTGAAVWWRAGDDATRRAFGRQTVAWGVVDLAIAGVGFWRSRRGSDPTATALRRTLGVNAALDVGYVGGGWWLLRNADRVHHRLPRYPASSARGDGAAIIVQGSFLLALDSGFLAMASRTQ